MAEAKTKPTNVSVDTFLDAVEHPLRRDDGHAVRRMMERITGEAATMWGPSIVGFGAYHYKYASGREGDMCRVGFSPRSTKLVLNKLSDVDEAILDEIVRSTYDAASHEGFGHGC